MVPEEVNPSNVKSLRPETEIRTDKEKELVNYVASKLAQAREKGLNTDSIVFCLIGEMQRDDGGHPDGVSIHYWIDDGRHVSKELSFVEKVLACEVNCCIDELHEA